MKTLIEVWHTDKDGWKSNYIATRSLNYDERGDLLPLNGWQFPDAMCYSQDDVDALRKLLDEIEKDLNEVND